MNLLKLDYYILKSYFKVIIGSFFLFFIMSVSMKDPSQIILMLTMSSVIFLPSLFSIIELNNLNKLYGILPVKKSDIVISKYVFSAFFIISHSLISLVLFCISSQILSSSLNVVSGLKDVSIALFVAMFFISIQLPAYFKLDCSKAKLIAFIPFLAIFAGSIPLYNLFNQYEWFSLFVENFSTYLETNIALALFTSLCIGIVLMFISCNISIALYNSKK